MKTRYAVVFPIILHEVEKGLTNSVILFQHVVSMLYNDDSEKFAWLQRFEVSNYYFDMRTYGTKSLFMRDRLIKKFKMGSEKGLNHSKSMYDLWPAVSWRILSFDNGKTIFP